MFERPLLNKVLSRLQEPKIQILLGARQVGKTTLVQQALKGVLSVNPSFFRKSTISLSSTLALFHLN